MSKEHSETFIFGSTQNATSQQAGLHDDQLVTSPLKAASALPQGQTSGFAVSQLGSPAWSTSHLRECSRYKGARRLAAM